MMFECLIDSQSILKVVNEKVFGIPNSYKERVTKFDKTDAFLALAIIVAYFAVMAFFGLIVPVCFAITNHYYRRRNKCTLCGFGSFTSKSETPGNCRQGITHIDRCTDKHEQHDLGSCPQFAAFFG